MKKEFIVNVFMAGPGLTYKDEDYMFPPEYTIPTIPGVVITDYRPEPAAKLEGILTRGDDVSSFVSVFNQPAKVVIDQDDGGINIALYPTETVPTKRLLIITNVRDADDDIPAQNYHYWYINWSDDETTFTYIAVYDIVL